MSVFVRNDEARRRAYAGAGVVALAWLALAAWGMSPWAMWLDHGHMGEHGAALPMRLIVFALGWALMVIAMMLPGTLPVVAHRAGSTPVLVAWVAVWVIFGVFSLLADGALHEATHHAPALAATIAPGLLLLAGIYQLTPIKRAFLARCRPDEMEPLAIEHAGTSARWLMGVRHGLNCVGSCWALMLLMMAFGGMSILSMALLGVVMTAERLARQGVMLAQVTGTALVVAALVMAGMQMIG